MYCSEERNAREPLSAEYSGGQHEVEDWNRFRGHERRGSLAYPNNSMVCCLNRSITMSFFHISAGYKTCHGLVTCLAKSESAVICTKRA